MAIAPATPEFPSTLSVQDRYPQLDDHDYSMRVRKKPTICVASCYGGGDRGIITCRVHREIEKITGMRMAELFDVFAGASTGGIIATAENVPDANNPLKPKFSADRLEQLFYEKSATIFPPAHWYAKPLDLIRPDFNPKGLYSVIQPFVGDLRLSQCLKEIIIPSAELTTGKPWWFTKTKVITDPRFTVIPPEVARQILAMDVVEATSAAPTYFPNKDITLCGKKYQFMDGGTFANNPSRRAVTYAQSLFGPNVNMVVGCFGTGEAPTGYPGASTQNAGLVYWGANFADATLSLTSDDIENEMQCLFPGQGRDQNLFVFQPKISTADSGLADSNQAHLKRLLEDTERMLEEMNEPMRLFCKKLEEAHDLREEVQAQPPH